MVFSYLVFVSRLSSIGYEPLMIFFFSNDLVCSLRLLLVIYLSFSTITTFRVRVAPCYVPSTYYSMPVTTRSQSKHLQNVNRVHSFSTTLGWPLSLMTSTTTSVCNLTMTTSVMVPTCNNTTITSSIPELSTIQLDSHDTNNTHRHLLSHSVSSPVSKIQIFEISNTSQFDPGIQQQYFS